ncbi:MAG: ATP-binding protein [Spirochaetaceae bacterium]|jgi:adenylate kinase family enzyme|nr:ATP-binding protein [Spirochaetaceae bacterium]
MIFPDIFWALKRVKVYALIGESGTGKSFRAKLVAQKYGIDFIIDDGLLIRDNRILTGHSAKREKTFLAAVKVALFDEKAHRDEVARRLQSEKFRKILILGTSEKMVNKIAARLQLPAPGKIIKIEDIASQEEIEKAIRTRRIEGKHVIPIPSIEVKRNYPGIFYDAIRIFKKNPVPGVGRMSKVHEKSVVRPEYSKRGKVIISEAALSQMVIHCVDEYNPNIRIKKIVVKDVEAGYRLVITIDVPLGTQLGGNIYAMQQYIIENLERYTGILIEEVNIIIDKIIQ